MKAVFVPCSVIVVCLALASASATHASRSPSAKPSIRITNLHSGQVINGSSITVDVAVSHFKLVKPILLPASQWKTIPLLPGDQGHIHYVLDSASNMVLTRDVVVKTSHTWTHVAPGTHTVEAYLATSQHALFPGTRAASVNLTVHTAPAAPRTGGGGHPPVRAMPRTGGAGGDGQSLPAPLALLGLLVFVVGLGVRARR